MKDLQSLLQARAAIQQQIAAIAAQEAGGAVLTAEQLTQFDQLTAEFDDLTKKIERQQASERMSATTATPVSSGVFAQPKGAPREKGENLAIMVRALVSGKGDLRAAAGYAEKEGAPEIAAALNTSTPSAGGYIVPPNYVPELIELLRPASVVRSLGARTLPMPGGTLTMPKVTAGSSASYGKEGDDIETSEPTFGDLNLSKKKLTALVPISNDLVRFSSPNANAFVRDDLIQSIGVREDQAFLRDDGTDNTPKGLRYLAKPTNVITANATVNVQNVANDAGQLELALLGRNIRMTTPGWVFAPRTLVFLQNLKDGNGNKVYPEIATGKWGSYPYRVTTSIPVNLGANGDESEIYLTDFSEAIIGEATGLILDVSSEAAYIENGQLVSAYSRDQTVVRAITEHDFGLRHDYATAVLIGVKWKP